MKKPCSRSVVLALCQLVQALAACWQCWRLAPVGQAQYAVCMPVTSWLHTRQGRAAGCRLDKLGLPATSCASCRLQGSWTADMSLYHSVRPHHVAEAAHGVDDEDEEHGGQTGLCARAVVRQPDVHQPCTASLVTLLPAALLLMQRYLLGDCSSTAMASELSSSRRCCRPTARMPAAGRRLSVTLGAQLQSSAATCWQALLEAGVASMARSRLRKGPCLQTCPARSR